MVINCNSLKSVTKEAAFRAHVEEHYPDIILRCESKINGTMPSYSLFPDNFKVYRKDRDQHGGEFLLQQRTSSFQLTCPTSTLLQNHLG